MPAAYKDYYQTLGVPKTASAQEIRKAFRAQARLCHPDVAHDLNKKVAEERFKDINEAYNVLSDEEKRDTYDRLGPNWRKPGVYRPQPTGPIFHSQTKPHQAAEEDPDYEVSGTGFSEFFEQIFSARHRFAKRNEAAAEKEKGKEPKGKDVVAELMVTLEEAMTGAVRSITLRRKTRCPECKGGGGGGILGQGECAQCEGKGQVPVTHTHKVKIPAGVRAGQRLRVPGQGEPGQDGSPAGDLYLRVEMASHPEFQVEGGDLYHELDLAPWEAALGAGVAVPSFDGSVNIKIPPGTQNGQRLRLRGRGLPGRDGERGDLFVVTRIQMPKAASDRAKALWEQLSREAAFDPRA